MKRNLIYLGRGSVRGRGCLLPLMSFVVCWGFFFCSPGWIYFRPFCVRCVCSPPPFFFGFFFKSPHAETGSVLVSRDRPRERRGAARRGPARPLALQPVRGGQGAGSFLGLAQDWSVAWAPGGVVHRAGISQPGVGPGHDFSLGSSALC